jgi:hypothetical protein
MRGIGKSNMKIYRSRRGIVVQDRGAFHLLPETNWDELFNRPSLEATLTSTTRPHGVCG